MEVARNSGVGQGARQGQSGARKKWIPNPAVEEPEVPPTTSQSQVAPASPRQRQAEVQQAARGPSRLLASKSSSSKCLLPSSLTSEQLQRRRSCQQLELDELGQQDEIVCSRPGRSTTRIEKGSCTKDNAPDRTSHRLAKASASMPAPRTLPGPMARWKSAHSLAQDIAAATAKDRSLHRIVAAASSANPPRAGGSVPPTPLRSPDVAVGTTLSGRTFRRSSSREEALVASQEEGRSAPDRPARGEGGRRPFKGYGAAAQVASRLQASVGSALSLCPARQDMLATSQEHLLPGHPGKLLSERCCSILPTKAVPLVLTQPPPTQLQSEAKASRNKRAKEPVMHF